MKSYEFLDVLVARAYRSPADKDSVHYVKLSESDIDSLSDAAEALFKHDPESLRGVPDMRDDEDSNDY